VANNLCVEGKRLRNALVGLYGWAKNGWVVWRGVRRTRKIYDPYHVRTRTRVSTLACTSVQKGRNVHHLLSGFCETPLAFCGRAETRYCNVGGGGAMRFFTRANGRRSFELRVVATMKTRASGGEAVVKTRAFGGGVR